MTQLAANARGLVRFPIRADVGAGEAKMQILCSAGPYSDASLVTVPVFTPATSEAFATYGEAAKGNETQIQAIVPPPNVIPQFGGLEVSLSSTALQACFPGPAPCSLS